MNTIENFSSMGPKQLQECFGEANAPDCLDLCGSRSGRLLAMEGALGTTVPRAFSAWIARSSFFPWRGKFFDAQSEDLCEGGNRFSFLGKITRFEASKDVSLIDGNPSLVLNYNVRGNPSFVRTIRDELREVSPGICIGPAFLMIGKPKLLFWFGVYSGNS